MEASASAPALGAPVAEEAETASARSRRVRQYWRDAFDIAHAVKRSRTLQRVLGFRGRESFGATSHAYLVHGGGYEPPKKGEVAALQPRGLLLKAGTSRSLTEAEEQLPRCSAEEAARVLNENEAQDDDEPTLMSASNCRESSHWALVRTTAFMTHFLGYARQRQQAKALLKLNREDSWRFNRLEGEGDLALYSSHNIMLRRRVKYDERVVALLKELWDCTAEDLEGDPECQGIGKEAFLAFATKCSLFLVPPPLHPDKLRAFCEEDWAKDCDEDGERMSPDRFCDSLFQVIDVWTDSVDADEYVGLLTKLRDGITYEVEEEKRKRRRFLEDAKIEHPEDLDDDLDVGMEDDEVIVVDATGLRKRARISLLESQVHRHLSVMPLKVREVNKEISRIYDAYIRANLRANEREGHVDKGDRSREMLLEQVRLALAHKRLDKFVVMWYQQKVGLRKILRRSLRNFATSVKALQGSHPRIKTFAYLVGLADNYADARRAKHAVDHFGDYYRPVLRRLIYANDRTVLDVFGEGSKPVWVSQRDFVGCATANLRHVPRGDPRYFNFLCELGKLAKKPLGKDVLESCGIDGTAKHAQASSVVPLDDAVRLLAPLWQAEDDWRDFQPRIRAIVKLQKFYQKMKLGSKTLQGRLESAKELDGKLNG